MKADSEEDPSHLGVQDQVVHMFFLCCSFFTRSCLTCVLMRLFSQAVCESLHIPDHRSGTLSGCVAQPQGQTGCTSANSQYLACWHPRKTLHGLIHPRSAKKGKRARSVFDSISPGCVQTLTNHILYLPQRNKLQPQQPGCVAHTQCEYRYIK